MNLLKFSRFLLILILPILIFLISVDFVAFNDSFYAKKFDEYGVKSQIPEAEALHSKVMDFITGKSNTLPSIFNEREKQHLADVRMLVRNLNIAVYLVMVLFVMLLVMFGLLLMEEAYVTGFMGKILVLGGSLSLIISFVFLLLAMFSFAPAFDSFHRIFFAQGTYTFNPENELIVKLYPEELFRDLGIKIMKTVVLLSSAVIILGSILVLHSKKAKE